MTDLQSIRESARERLAKRPTAPLLWAADRLHSEQRGLLEKMVNASLRGVEHRHLQDLRDKHATVSCALDLLCEELERRDPAGFARWMDSDAPDVSRFFDAAK